MSLPFLKARKLASVMMAVRKPDGGTEVTNEEGEPTPELLGAATSLLRAIQMKDANAVAEALEDAYEACEGYSDEESEA